MKKILVLVLTLVLCVSLFAGCGNVQLIDTTWKYDRAMVKLPDGTVVVGTCTSWRDYDGCDSVQVVIDGVTYYTHLNNVCLIDD